MQNSKTVASDDKKNNSSSNSGGSNNSGGGNSQPAFSLPGFIFNRDPLTDTNDFDLPLADIFQLPGQAATIVDLKTSGPLSNGLVSVPSDTEFPDKVVNITAATTELPYRPKDPEFAQVNSFYHANALIQRLKSLSQFPQTYPPITLDAHCDQEDNAYYDPQNDLICLGYSKIGTLKAYTSFDADVVTHEFGHSLNANLISSPETFLNWESFAIDEGTADLWAFTMNGRDPRISYFFGRFVYEAAGLIIPGGENPLRDIRTTRQYPSQVVNEEHEDSFFWSSAVYQLSKDPVFATDTGKLIKLVARVIGDLQKPANFGVAIKALRDEAAAFGANVANLDTFLTARGLLRRDDVTKLVLEFPATDVRVLDYNPFGTLFPLPGNCNGILDVGETAAVLVDLKNGGLGGAETLGNTSAVLTTTAAPTDVQIIPGGDYAFYTQFIPMRRYTQIPQMSPASSRYKFTLFSSVFLLKGKKVGTYDFSVLLTGTDSIDGNPTTKTINFSITVGNSPLIQCGG